MRYLLRALALAVLAALLYAGTLRGAFLRWDDHSLVLENTAAALPLKEAVRQAFAHPSGVTYWPLRDLSYALDHALWGFNPFGFHLTNLLLYAAVTAGLYLAARRVLGEGAAFLGALLFAVHPLHAEPVAWISGRKDLLCAFWLVLAWWALSTPPEARNGRRLLRFTVGLLAYLAACLSKTAALPFPLAWWAHDRLIGDRLLGRREGRWTWFERLPFLIVMVLLGLAQLVVSTGAGAAGAYTHDLQGMRQALATPLKALIDQVGALVLPMGLSPVYPVSGGWNIAALAAAGVAAWALWSARRGEPSPALRGLMFGQAWVLLFLLPVINLGVATSTPRADRYAFLPSMGFCLAVGGILAAGWRDGALRRALAAGLVLCWAVAASAQGATWHGDGTLWEPCLRRHPDSFLAAGGMAWAHADGGRPGSARRYLERMVKIDPASPIGHRQMGGFLKQTGDLSRALLEYVEADRLYSEGGKGRTGVRVAAGYGAERVQCLLEMGDLALAMGSPELAAAWTEKAIALDPSFPDAHWHRALAAQREGDAALAASLPQPAAAAFSRVLAEGVWMAERGQGRPEVVSRMAYALVRLSLLTNDAAESRKSRMKAEALYRGIPSGSLSEADRRNLAGLLRVKASDLVEAGNIPAALGAILEACALRPDDAELQAVAAQLGEVLR